MTRYSKMLPSTIVDEDGDTFPDPLSLDYGHEITKLPTSKMITANDIAKFWITYYEQYKETEGDDVLLSKNQVPYIGMMKPGDTIYFFDGVDLDNISFEE